MASYEVGQSIAYVYAEALYDVAAELGTIAETEQELDALARALADDVRLRLFLDTPTVPVETKRKVLTSALSGVSKPVLNLMLLAIEHARINVFGSIASGFHRHANKKAGIAEVEVAAARPLEAIEQQKLKTMLTAKFNQKIVLIEHIRPELLGGLILTHDGRSWDGSILHRLGRIVDKIEEAKVAAKFVE
jgi:F-type H+-transporting ATPase subunit delta